MMAMLRILSINIVCLLLKRARTMLAGDPHVNLLRATGWRKVKMPDLRKRAKGH